MNSTPGRRWSRICIVCLFPILTCMGCGQGGDEESPEVNGGLAATSSVELVLTSEQETQIVDFCGDCHAMPLASSFPKKNWHEEVERGFGFFYEAEDSSLSPPVFNHVVEYFKQRAPDSIPVTQSQWPVAAKQTPFVAQANPLRPLQSDEGLPAIAGMSLEPLGPQGELYPVYCDMRLGTVAWADVSDSKVNSYALAKLASPARGHLCDLNGDGTHELVVAELGTFLPEDHKKGAVVAFPIDEKRRPGSNASPSTETADLPEGIPLLDEVGRVADVRSGDFDGDGDIDLVAAEFGWLKTGGVWILWNQGNSESSANGLPEFRAEKIDGRHGAIHVPVVDFDKDGDLDIVVLLSQEYESVEVYLNDGTGEFTTQVLYEAGDPAFGSSGIELCDMDGDQDLDVVYVNGDTFDSYFVKPYHSIRWLENRGEDGFEAHVLTDMPGAQHASVADVDNDGDLDIVGVALMPVYLRTEHRDKTFGSVLLLRNDGKGNFEGILLEEETCNHASCLLHDVDRDGDVDLLVSNFLSETDETMNPISLWENQSANTSTVMATPTPAIE